jgi:hypothetical protein
VWGKYTSDGKSATSKAEAFFKEATPWGTGVDHLGQSSRAGEKQVAQLRTQIADLKKVKEPKGKRTPKRGEKRDRSSDDDEDLEAVDESSDSGKPTPKPPRRGAKREDDDEDMEALDESPDSKTPALVTELHLLKATLVKGLADMHAVRPPHHMFPLHGKLYETILLYETLPLPKVRANAQAAPSGTSEPSKPSKPSAETLTMRTDAAAPVTIADHLMQSQVTLPCR